MRLAAFALALILLSAGVETAKPQQICYAALVKRAPGFGDADVAWIYLQTKDTQGKFAGTVSFVADLDVPFGQALVRRIGTTVTLCLE